MFSLGVIGVGILSLGILYLHKCDEKRTNKVSAFGSLLTGAATLVGLMSLNGIFTQREINIYLNRTAFVKDSYNHLISKIQTNFFERNEINREEYVVEAAKIEDKLNEVYNRFTVEEKREMLRGLSVLNGIRPASEQNLNEGLNKKVIESLKQIP